MIIEVVESAFLDAFDTNDLKRLARYSLGISLDRITQDGNLENTVHDLISWSEKANKLEQLIRAAKDVTTNAKIASLPDEIVSSNRVVSQMNQVSLDVVLVRLDLLTQQLKRLANIVEGPNGGNGVQWQSKENAREIADIKKIVLEIKQAQSNEPHVLDNPIAKRYFFIALAFILTPVVIEIGKLIYGAV